MKFKLLALSFVSALAMSSVSAKAECIIRGGNFFPAQNDSVTAEATVSGDGVCSRTFSSGSMTIFTNTTILNKPKNGSLSLSGQTFDYKAKSGFKGNDQFVVKVCGKNNAGSGCSTLTYNVTVQ